MTTETETTRWICQSCGFIYDPEEGDPDGGGPPGTPFEDIPDDWFCPVCGARKNNYEPAGDWAPATQSSPATCPSPRTTGPPITSPAPRCPTCGCPPPWA